MDGDKRLEELIYRFLDKYYPITDGNVLHKQCVEPMYEIINMAFGVNGLKLWYNWLYLKFGEHQLYHVMWRGKRHNFDERLKYTPMKDCYD